MAQVFRARVSGMRGFGNRLVELVAETPFQPVPDDAPLDDPGGSLSPPRPSPDRSRGNRSGFKQPDVEETPRPPPGPIVDQDESSLASYALIGAIAGRGERGIQ